MIEWRKLIHVSDPA